MTFLQKSFSTNQLEKNIHILCSILGALRISCVQIYIWKISNSSHLCIISHFLHLDLLLSLQLPKWAICILVSTILFFKNTVLHVWLILLVKHKLFSFVKMSTFNFILMWGRPHQNATPNFRPNFFGLRSNNKFARAGDV